MSKIIIMQLIKSCLCIFIAIDGLVMQTNANYASNLQNWLWVAFDFDRILNFVEQMVFCFTELTECLP